MTEEELTRLEALEQAATPGPWVSLANDSVLFCDVYSVAGDNNSPIIGICRMPESDDRIADMAFIAEARNALPSLIAEVRRLRVLWDAVEVLGRANWNGYGWSIQRSRLLMQDDAQ